ncbi:hypothetical protein MMC08_002068, partial [Hypocenomyce scalaris]|nr:hypothetical protein [Hypocenomyce scalaris]
DVVSFKSKGLLGDDTGEWPGNKERKGSKLEEETEGDILLARKRREANDRYFRRVNGGMLDVVGRLEEVAAAMEKVERESREIWNESDRLTELKGLKKTTPSTFLGVVAITTFTLRASSDARSTNTGKSLVRWLAHEVMTYNGPDGSLYDEIVHVKVGANKIDYGVHKDLLCHYSSYFAAALNGNFKEAKENTVELVEDSPKLFEQSQLWLYTQYLCEKAEDETTPGLDEMAKLYVWADKRGIPKLQDPAIDAIIRKSKFENLIPTSYIRLAYDNLPASDPLRRLLIDFCVHCGDIDKLFRDIDRKRSRKKPSSRLS